MESTPTLAREPGGRRRRLLGQADRPLNVPNCNLTNLLVYLEGPDSGVDMYVDDAVVTQ